MSRINSNESGSPVAADPRLIGQRLTEARKASGKTQEEAAAHLGYSRPTFIAIEKGSRPAKAEEIIKLASLYGRSVHELVRPGGPPVALVPHLRGAIDPSGGDVDALNNSIKELERFAEDYRELERLLTAPLSVNYPPEVQLPSRGNLADFADDVAARERGRLLLGDQPILSLRRVLETEVGVRIFYGSSLPSSVAGMYAFVSDLGYCILINRRHPPERQRASQAHEYGHFLVDRHKPGIDRLGDAGRKQANERFAEAFGMSFLMPKLGVSRQFHDIVTTSGDFQVADLCRLSNYYFVSVQAMTFRLEGLGLIPRGTWSHLMETGFKANAAKKDLSLCPTGTESIDPYPQRYKFLAVQAYQRELISEGQLARFLRTDRVTAREIVAECLSHLEVDAQGNTGEFHLDFDVSLLTEPS